MTDELGKPFEFCFFSSCADDPISAHPLVPGSLRAEEFPSGFAGAKLFGLFTSELRALPLFVRVDRRLLCAARGESLETFWTHQTHFLELLGALDVNGAPGAGGPAWSKANRIASLVEALSNAVDPAEAEGRVHRFGPGDAGLFRNFSCGSQRIVRGIGRDGLRAKHGSRTASGRRLVLAAWRLIADSRPV